ncbi:MAG: hypothetical protein LBL70_07320, partial [Treponema sp.]|nr:hypothetical protein [Treponema sp.]
MRNILRNLLFGLLLFFRLPLLPAESIEAPPAKGNLIAGTLVTGLKRTRPQVAQEALRKFIGQDAASVDLNEVRAAILDTGILEPLDVEILDTEERGALIRVEVRDKWSIFPIPVFFIGSGGFQAGAAFFDANALGLNQKAAVTGMYRSNGWMVYGMYSVPPNGKRRPGWMLSGSFSRNEREDQDQKENALRRFNLDSVNTLGALNFRFTDILDFSLRFGYAGQFLRETEDPLRAPDSDAQGLRTGAGFSLKKTDWDGYLLSEKSASLGYTRFFGLDSPSFHSLRFDGTLQQSIVPGFRTDLRGGLLYEP